MPGGIASKFGSEKVSRYTGVSQLQLRVSRYTVRLRFPEGASNVPLRSTPLIRKILVSITFLSAILGPEMAAPILWAPRKNAFFLQEKPLSIKFLVLGGGGYFGGNPKGPLFKGASFKTQVDHRPTATRTCK